MNEPVVIRNSEGEVCATYTPRPDEERDRVSAATLGSIVEDTVEEARQAIRSRRDALIADYRKLYPSDEQVTGFTHGIDSINMMFAAIAKDAGAMLRGEMPIERSE